MAAWFVGAHALHDRFMLPHFVRRDFFDVLTQLRRVRLQLSRRSGSRRSWSFAFRRSGQSLRRECELELRQALEPWNVLAEETTSGRTVRTVDSSLERMQVKLSGLHHRIPLRWLHATAARCRSVLPANRAKRSRRTISRSPAFGGAYIPQFRCTRRLSSTLSTAGTSAPIGRCTYHVGPPDGRVYMAGQ